MFDITREITVQSPPHNIMIAETQIDPETVAAAVQSDPMWSSELTTVEHPDGGYFQWGDDPRAPDVQRLSPMRPLGQGGQLAVIGSDADATVVRTIDAADMEAVLSTVAGNSDSLLDDALFAAAVPALGDDDVIQVTAVDPVTQEPLADLLPGAEVAAVGPVVVVTLPFEGAYPMAQRMLMQRSLFPTG